MTGEARLRMDFQPGQHETVVPFEFYFGPNHFKTLKSFDQKYEKIIPLGGWLVGWFTRFVIILCSTSCTGSSPTSESSSC